MAFWTAASRFFGALALAAAMGAAAAAAPVKTAHLEAELVAQGEAVPGGTTYVALVQRLEPGWHSYWRNPGSAGEPTQVVWTLPPGWKAGEIVWATPRAIPVGPLMSYGYEDEVVLPIPITAPADAKPGSRVTLNGEAAFLVCKEVCIPAQASLSVDLVVAALPREDRRGGPIIRQALELAPKLAGLPATIAAGNRELKLAVTGLPAIEPNDDVYFFAFSAAQIDAAAPQAVERGPDGVTLTLKPAPGADLATLNGVLSINGHGIEISARNGALPPTASGLGSVAPAKAGPSTGLPLAVLFAFLGGMILNLMPCVFPVLSMKAAQLSAHAHDRAAARAQGLAFLGGVLITFLTLAGALLAARTAGSTVGWGFQLQSPAVTAALAILMLLVALNLFGLFEVGASVQGLGEGFTRRSGLIGAAFTGALAVVVAAPCTAPFMAPAIGYAVTRPAAEALAIFAALGLGFALPFTALAFAPGLLRRLPKPGPWMTTFKTVLAFPMLAAAAWLAWVFVSQTDVVGLGALFAAALIVAFGAWLFGRGQTVFPQWQRICLQAALPLALLISAAILAGPLLVAAERPRGTLVVQMDRGPSALSAVPWSPEAVTSALAEGKVVFVDFTAAWCITCQVNEGMALSSGQIAETFAKTNAVYMKADWTNPDPVIAKALAEHGRAGVPLYLVYPAGGGEPRVLPELLTEGMVREALEAAARPAARAARG